MKKLLLLSLITLFISCANQDQECETPSNGFIEGTELNIQMGEQNGVDIFKEIDAAWAEFNFEKVKNYVHDDAVMKFADKWSDGFGGSSGPLWGAFICHAATKLPKKLADA